MNADKDTATPRPWHRDAYGQVKGPDGRSVCLTRFALSSGFVPPESIANDKLVFAAVNSWDAHRQLAEAAREVIRSLDADPEWRFDDASLSNLRAALAALDAVEKP